MYMMSQTCTDSRASRSNGVFFFLFWGGKDEGTQWHSAYKFHCTNQENNLLIWNMAILNIWSIKVTSRKPWVCPPTLPIHRISLHCSTK